MDYQLHLYVPKNGELTPANIKWMTIHGQRPDVPEARWPVRKLRPKALARVLLSYDRTLIPEPGDNDDVWLIYPMQEIGIRFYLHERGVILLFPYMGGALAQIVLRILYNYIRFLYDTAGFWSYDPQLRVISYADDMQSIEETAELMEALLPRLLNEAGGG